MTIMVTGGTGAIGSMLVQQLIAKGENTVAYDLYPDTSLLGEYAKSVKLVRGDVRDLPTLLRTVKENKVDKIIHCAAIIGQAANDNPMLALEVNVGGTVNVLELARTFDIERIIFLSTVDVFGVVKGQFAHPTLKPMDEDQPKNPVGLYGVTKLCCEHYGLAYLKFYGVNFIALRFSSLYGPGRLQRHGAFAVIDRMLSNAIQGIATKIPVGGDARLQWTYTKDIARGIILACFAEKLEHRIFHVSTHESSTFNDAAKIIKSLVPGAKIEIGGGLDYLGYGYPRECYLDTSRAKQEVGFSAQYTLETGIKDYYAMMTRQP